MTVPEMQAALDLTAATRMGDGQIVGAICTDLLSDILGNGDPGEVWITIQTHRNVAAVAAAQGLAAVVITASRRPAEDLLQLAQAEGITIFTTPADSYEVAGRLWELGVR
jgi:hypothetical protein